MGLIRKLVSAAERERGRISVCGRVLIGCSLQRVWRFGFQLQPRVVGVQIQPADQYWMLTPPARCYPTFWQRDEG